MSAEVLAPGHGRYFADEDNPFQVPAHQPIHDLESLFWVLVYICLTRSGPGGTRRKELGPEADLKDTKTQSLHHFLYCFFDAEEDDILNDNKRRFFSDPTGVEGHIIPNIHPYFACLGDVLKEYWRQLQLSYRVYDDWEMVTIHDKIIQILTDGIERTNLVPEEEEYKAMATTELKRREDELKSFEGTKVPRLSDDTDETLSRSPKTQASDNQAPQYNAAQQHSDLPPDKKGRHGNDA